MIISLVNTFFFPSGLLELLRPFKFTFYANILEKQRDAVLASTRLNLPYKVNKTISFLAWLNLQFTQVIVEQT